MKLGNKSLLYVAISLAAIAGTWGVVQMSGTFETIDASDEKQVAQGKMLYETHCAACHGANLEGETPDWRSQKKDGTLPAPPHDESGHSWHHDDQLLFDYTKKGGAALTPPGFKSAMPAFADRMTDTEIRAVLAFIKNSWPKDIQARQQRMNDRNQK